MCACRWREGTIASRQRNAGWRPITGAMTGAIIGTPLSFPRRSTLSVYARKDITIPKGTEITAYVNGAFRLTRKDLPRKRQAILKQLPHPFSRVGWRQPPRQNGVALTQHSQLETSSPRLRRRDHSGTRSSFGSTPASLRLAAGDHKIRLEKSGLRYGKEH